MRLRTLFETPVEPGQRKGFSLQLQRIEDVQLKVADIQSTISQLKIVDVPDALKKQMEDLINAAKIEKEKIYADISDKSVKNPIIRGIPQSVLKLFKGIEKNASTIMNAYRNTGKFLYRGINSSDDAIYGKPFDQRRPKDSNLELNTILNQALADQGFTARRDNTSFTSGNPEHARNYGTVYIIFPSDGFSFHYSKEIRDLVLDTSKLYLLVDTELTEHIESIIYGNWEKLKPYFNHRSVGATLFRDYEYPRDIDGIQRAVADGALPPEFEKIKSLADLVDSKKVIDNFKYNQDDLDGAIKSNHEVMLTGPYYAIRSDKLENYLKKYIELTKTGAFDITPDTKSEKDKFNKSINAVVGGSNNDFEIGSWVEHKYEKIIGQVVDSYHTNDFVNVKDYSGKLFIVNKKNLNKIKTPEFPNYNAGDKLYISTDDTDWDSYNNKKFKVVGVDEFTVNVINPNNSKIITVPKPFTKPAPKYDTDNPDIKDTVHVTSGDYEGLYGTITYVSGYSKDIDVDFGDGKSISVSKGNYEVVDPATKPESSTLSDAEFEKDDYVQVKDDDGDYSTIVGIAGKPGIKRTEIKAFNNTYTFSIKNSRLIKIDKDKYEKQTFKTYTTVKVIGGKQDGLVGQFTYAYQDGKLEILSDDGKVSRIPAKYVFNLTDDDTDAKTDTKTDTDSINEGDFVKISKNSNVFPGTVAKVQSKESKESFLLSIYGNEDFDYAIDTNLLTKISEEEFNKGAFKVGDKVKVIAAGPFKDKIGTVDKLSYFQHIRVTIDGTKHNIDPINLEIISNINNKTDDDDLIDLDSIDWEADDEFTPPNKAQQDVKKKTNDFIELGKKQGYVTFVDIDKLFKELPAEFNSAEQINNFMVMLAELGINVSPGSSSINTPQERQARVNDPDVKADLKEILKNSKIKEIIQKSIETKIMTLDDSVEIYTMIGYDKWMNSVRPYIELKGVKIS
jgi:hypothetical protein